MDHGKHDMRIIVTGANGFVGSRICSRLLDDGNEVIPLVQETFGLRGEMVVDYCDIDFVARVNELPKAEVIVHVGSKIGWYGGGLAELYVPNVLATAELANLAGRMQAQFIFTSAAIVHGVGTPQINSRTAENPDTDYGYSKWLAEKMIQMSGVEYLILRMAGVFGKNGPSHLGLNNAIREAVKGKAPELKGDGTVRRNYIYVEDLAELVRDAVRKRISGVHLVAGPEPLTIRQMFDEICQVFIPGQRIRQSASDRSVKDQIIEHSPELLRGRRYLDALRDIKNRIL